ncbi:hypothetical protein [Kitasatospora sp. NPDC088783]|uniref:hypothetical protein n=1 Tax=Kitasatospora sp. NPDC088783 TaxID=3364077 RepID=UPI003812679C
MSELLLTAARQLLALVSDGSVPAALIPITAWAMLGVLILARRLAHGSSFGQVLYPTLTVIGEVAVEPAHWQAVTAGVCGVWILLMKLTRPSC